MKFQKIYSGKIYIQVRYDGYLFVRDKDKHITSSFGSDPGFCMPEISEGRCEMMLEIEKQFDYGRRHIVVRIMNPNDPLFYYEGQLSEAEYTQFTSEQNILVRFEEFPQKLLDFVKCVLSCGGENNPRYQIHLNLFNNVESAKIHRGLNMGSTDAKISYSDRNNIQNGVVPNDKECISGGYLNIIEINTFKQINHVSILLIRGSDDLIKQRLCVLNLQYQDEINVLKNRIIYLEDIEKNKFGNTEMVNSMKNEILGLKTKIHHQDSVIRGYEQRKDHYNTGYSQDTIERTDKMEELQEKNTELKGQIENLSNKIRDLLKENSTLIMNKDTFGSKNILNNDIVVEREKELNCLKNELNIEKIYKDRLEGDLKESKNETKKANEIISKLQNEIRNIKTKLKGKVTDLESKLRENQDSNMKNEILLRENKKLSNDLEKSSENINLLKNDLKLYKDEVEKQNKTIEWLRKKNVSDPFGFQNKLKQTRIDKSFKTYKDIEGILNNTYNLTSTNHTTGTNSLNTLDYFQNFYSNKERMGEALNKENYHTSYKVDGNCSTSEFPQPPVQSKYPVRPNST